MVVGSEVKFEIRVPGFADAVVGLEYAMQAGKT